MAGLKELADRYDRIAIIVRALEKNKGNPEIASTAYETLIEEACEAQQIADGILEARDLAGTAEVIEEELERHEQEIVEDLHKYQEETGPTPAPATSDDEGYPF